MAVKSKTQLATDISTNIGATYNQTNLQTVLGDIVDSYEDIFSQLTTVQRDAIVTPASGLIIYNTDNNRLEYWNGSAWFGIGQNLSTPITEIVTLSSAQLLALNGTPVQLVAAPGAGLAIIPTDIVYYFTYGSTQYTGSFNLRIFSTTATGTNPFFLVDGAAIRAAGNRSAKATVQTSASYNCVVENDSISIDASGAVAAGDGTLKIWITYSIITI